MNIGTRLRALRELKKITQGEIGTRAGLQCAYVSRVENGHTVPGVETLERWARALEIPLYQLFYEGEEIPAPPMHPKHYRGRQLRELSRLLGNLDDRQRWLLFAAAKMLAKEKKSNNGKVE